MTLVKNICTLSHACRYICTYIHKEYGNLPVKIYINNKKKKGGGSLTDAGILFYAKILKPFELPNYCETFILFYRNNCGRLITKNMKQHKLPSAFLNSLML